MIEEYHVTILRNYANGREEETNGKTVRASEMAGLMRDLMAELQDDKITSFMVTVA